MTEIVDFFFSPYPSAGERRLFAALQDGLAHGSRIAPHDPTPGEPVTLHFYTNASLPIDQVAVYYTTNGTEPSGTRGASSTSSVVMARPGERRYDSKMDMLVQHWQAVLPGQPDGTLVRYRADGWSTGNPTQQMHWYADNVDPVSTPPIHGRHFAYNVDRWHTPEWFYDAVIYHIFVDRFNAAHDEPPMRNSSEITDFFGGTLRGVLEKLDYISALGANCIWLSPIFESPTHHGYNPSDYYNVATRYGTNVLLRRLIDEAHRRGMRVLLDFVANHTSDEHPSFLAARTDPHGPTAHWYSFDHGTPHGYRSYTRIENMPELVTEHPDVQRYLIDAALHWLGYFGADGLRLDYVPGPPHAFWAIFQREIKQHFPQALTLGEITSPVEEMADYAGRMDACMDFPLTGMMRRVFALRNATLSELLAFLDERIPQLPPGMGLATLLNNHDMHRFLWIADGDTARLKLAAACHLTLEGTPIIYYGTEVGLSQDNDAHKENAYARAPMIWDERQDSALLAYYQHMIALRHRYAVLRHGAWMRLSLEVIGNEGDARELKDAPRLDRPPDAAAPLRVPTIDDKDQVGAYLRFIKRQDVGEQLIAPFCLVVLNNGERSNRIRMQVAEQLALAGIEVNAITSLQDVLAMNNDQEIVLVDGVMELELAALGAAILVPRE